jgi:hypothetical protein
VNVRSKIAGAMLVFISLCSLPANAGDKSKPENGGQNVDSGSFGVFVNGQRVATETFTIKQVPGGSIASAQFKTEGGSQNQSSLSAEMEMTSAGELKKYEWKELSPGQARATVMPANDFLTERVIKTPKDKPEEQPFMLPSSTSILDDYFFSHRQILIWRFLATTCKQENGQVKCPANQKTLFGALNPQQRAAMQISLEYTGRDKTKIRGTDQDCNRFILKSDGGEWILWVDDQFKLQRILIAGDNTEVVRDQS